jgi:hypothetical protein
VPNAASSQATRLANRLFVVAGYLVRDFQFVTIKSIADPGQAAPLKTAIQTGVNLI